MDQSDRDGRQAAERYVVPRTRLATVTHSLVIFIVPPEIITAISEFADAVSILGSSDLSKQLSNSLIVLADVERKGKELMEQQSRHDLETVLGTVEEYLRLIASIRVRPRSCRTHSSCPHTHCFCLQLAFASRIKLFYAWKAADAERIRVRNMHEKTLRQRVLDRQSIIPIQREIEQVRLSSSCPLFLPHLLTRLTGSMGVNDDRWRVKPKKQRTSTMRRQS